MQMALLKTVAGQLLGAALPKPVAGLLLLPPAADTRLIQGIPNAMANLPKTPLLQAVVPKPKAGLLLGAGCSQPKSVLELQAKPPNPGPRSLSLLLLLLAPKPPVPKAGQLLARQEAAGLLSRETSPKPVTELLLEAL